MRALRREIGTSIVQLVGRLSRSDRLNGDVENTGAVSLERTNGGGTSSQITGTARSSVTRHQVGQLDVAVPWYVVSVVGSQSEDHLVPEEDVRWGRSLLVRLVPTKQARPRARRSHPDDRPAQEVALR